MRPVNIMNDALTSILDQFINLVEKSDVVNTMERLEGNQRDWHTSLEYLETLYKQPHDGYPESAYSYCLKPEHHKSLDSCYKKEYNILDWKIRSELGIQHCALSQMYPEGGYIGWHSNEETPAHNLIFTWSETGDGYFEWVDPITKEHIRMQDTQGWQCKAGYFGEDKHDRIFHHASTNCKRVTLSYTLGFDEEFWEDCIDHIERG